MPLVFGEDGYDLTENPHALPAELLDIPCRRIYVEFLKLDSSGKTVEEKNNAKNHAVIKIDFKHKVDDRYRGARLHVQPNFDLASTEGTATEPSYKPGQMMFKPVRYAESSNSSARTCKLPRADVTVGQLVGHLTYHQLHFFYFVTINDKYFGCRDFLTQVIHMLANAGYINKTIEDSSPRNPRTSSNIFKVLGLRFTPRGIASCPIDQGHFVYYQRVITEEMAYAD